MAHDVFISYSHKDQTIADAVCHKLESSGIRCWYAPRNIQPGDDWAGAIIQALETSRIMVLIFTDDSNISVQVNREVSTAVSAGVMILPLKCTQNAPTASMRYYLSTVHWMDAMDKPMENAIDNLADCTRRILFKEPQEDEPKLDSAADKGSAAPVVVAKRPISAGKKLAIAAGGVLLAALVILLAVLLPGKENGKDPAVPAAQTVDDMAAQTGEEVQKPAPSTVVLDEGNDSPGAEFYLYTVSNSISDVYDQAIILEKYFGEETEEIVIPEIVDGLPVVAIGEKCFEGNTTLKKVMLPETLETIGYRAFYGCTSLCDINLPDSLLDTSGWAFAHTALEEFIAPPNFEYLGYGTFYSCEKLKKVVLTEAVSEIGADTFGYLASGAEVTLPNPDLQLDIKAFREEEEITLIAPAGAAAETYAKAMKLHFQAY